MLRGYAQVLHYLVGLAPRVTRYSIGEWLMYRRAEIYSRRNRRCGGKGLVRDL